MPMILIVIDPKSATPTFSNCYPLVKFPLEWEFHLGKKPIKWQSCPKNYPKSLPKSHPKSHSKSHLKIHPKKHPKNAWKCDKVHDYFKQWFGQ